MASALSLKYRRSARPSVFLESISRCTPASNRGMPYPPTQNVPAYIPAQLTAVNGGRRRTLDAEVLEIMVFVHFERRRAEDRGASKNARGRNRTGTGFPPRDFLTHYSFHCCTVRAFGVWTLPLPCRALEPRGVGRGRQVSTLSTHFTPAQYVRSREA